MKPKHTVSDWVELPCPRPHLDEVEDVVATLEIEGLAVSISDDSHEFASLREFIEHRGKTARKLQIAATGENAQRLQKVKVTFANGFVTLSRWASAENEGVWHRLVGYFQSRGGRFFKVAASPFWGYLLLLTMISSGGILLNPDPLPQRIGIWLLVLVTVLWIVSTVISKYGQVIVLERRHSAGFWRRNRDQLVLILVGALIGSLITAVLAILTGSR